MAEAAKILELGCGASKTPGAVGVDRVPGPGVDVVHDLGRLPWPFPDASFDEVRLSHILEDLDDVLRAMEEVHRICRPGAQVLIWTPHYSSMNSWTDPTHCVHMGLHSMDLFTKDARYDYTKARFAIAEKRITFGLGLLCLPGKLINAWSPDAFEKYFAFIFPARDLFFRLQALK
ncbi:MAG: methyltransferase domain-containing protein [Elusimicrobia bacterium]|nr:methyltransferase domain-containing protein [Elusimicrobiota bacterium]